MVVEILEAVKLYKHKACGLVDNNCDKCEAAFMYYDKQFCCFDTVIRFIEWDSEYNEDVD